MIRDFVIGSEGNSVEKKNDSLQLIFCLFDFNIARCSIDGVWIHSIFEHLVTVLQNLEVPRVQTER